MIILITGMVVDGARQSSAVAHAEASANAAARAGVDAASTSRLAGRVDTQAAVSAARTALAADPTVTGSVRMETGGTLRVSTSVRKQTLFLSIVGISSVRGTGAASAVLVETGGTP